MRVWLKASRLPSQSYIFLPLLLGQLLAVRSFAAISWPILALVHLVGLFLQLTIVYGNDYADRETDALNATHTIYSGGSRVIPDGELTARQLGRAALLTAALGLLGGGGLTLIPGRVAALPLVGAGLGLLWLYSFPPARLNYRGGGELLQMLGVGLVLPLLGFHAQGGELAAFPWPLLGGLLPGQLACALSTALPDEPSDRQSRKRTLAVLLGGGPARIIVIALHGAGLGVLLELGAPATVVALPVAALLGLALLLRGARPGTRWLTAFVTLSVLAAVGVTAALCVAAARP